MNTAKSIKATYKYNNEAIIFSIFSHVYVMQIFKQIDFIYLDLESSFNILSRMILHFCNGNRHLIWLNVYFTNSDPNVIAGY